MDLKIEEFYPKKAPDEFWESYFEFNEAVFRHQHPDDPLPNREAVIQRQKTDMADFIVTRWLAYSPEGKIVGWAGSGVFSKTSPNYEQNKHIAQMNIVTHPEHYRKGIGTALLRVVAQHTHDLGRTTFEINTDYDSGRFFLEHYGGKLSLEGSENRLNLEDVNWDLMQKWVDEGPKRAEGVTIESFFQCPEEIIDEYCAMYTSISQLVPLGEVETQIIINRELRRKIEKQHKDAGQIYYTLISREKDGRISGMTEIILDPRESHKIEQELTGVLPKYRGRGLGKWLKAQMLFYIKENYPEARQIITGNADTNAPMLSINKRMGFKRYKGGSVYKLQIEELMKNFDIRTERDAI